MYSLGDKSHGSSMIGLRLAPPASQVSSAITAKRSHIYNARKLNKKASSSTNKTSMVKKKQIVPVMIDLSSAGMDAKRNERHRKNPSATGYDKENITQSSDHSLKANISFLS